MEVVLELELSLHPVPELELQVALALGPKLRPELLALRQ